MRCMPLPGSVVTACSTGGAQHSCWGTMSSPLAQGGSACLCLHACVVPGVRIFSAAVGKFVDGPTAAATANQGVDDGADDDGACRAVVAP